jgi:hypothetical protein
VEEKNRLDGGLSYKRSACGGLERITQEGIETPCRNCGLGHGKMKIEYLFKIKDGSLKLLWSIFPPI